MPRGVRKIDLGYHARDHFQAFHARTQRWACIVAHRRAGKTVACVMDLIDAALRCKKQDGRFAYISPTYTQSKNTCWQYLKRFTADIPGVEQRESDLMVVFQNGCRVRLYGADNYDRLRGTYMDGLVLDEYADINPRAWPEVLRPELADRSGWAVFIGTPRGRNDFWRVHHHAEQTPEWFSLVLRASRTGLLQQAELDDMRNTLTAEQYDQELECSFDAAILGSYYGREIAEAEAAGRIGDVPYDPLLPVHTAWDLGIGDSTAIWFFQVSRDGVRVIDYYEASGYGLSHYASVLSSRDYTYGTDYLPHDGEARQLGTGRSLWETLHALTNRIPRILPKQNVMDGINAARVTIGKAWFDGAKCYDGLEALRAYRADFDEKAKVFQDRPRHDWSSHGCLHGDTILLTRNGMCRIMDLPETGEVSTPCGWRQYHYPRITLRNAQLVEVVFSDGHTVKCTPDHLFLTASGWISANSLLPGSVIQSISTRSTSILTAVSTGFGHAKDIMRGAASGCIETFGRMPSDLFRAVATFIIGTETRQTIRSSTWNVSQLPCIFPELGTLSLQGCNQGQNTSASWLGRGLLNGISQRKGGFGIDVTHYERRVGLSGDARKNRVSSAVRCSTQLSESRDIQGNSAATTAKHLTIAGVRHLKERADVWDITVPGPACFALANGAVVHNSDAFRYLALAWREMAPEKPKPRPVDSWERSWRQSSSQGDVAGWRVA